MAESPVEAETSRTPIVSIRADLASRVTLATHQCDVPILMDLVIVNELDSDLEDLSLSLRAAPKVIGDRHWKIDRIAARSEFRVSDRSVTLAGGMLDGLTERMRAEVVFELCRGERVIAEYRHSLAALARNEWGGARSMPELLAAFVTPNDPAIQRLLKEASRILEANGKGASLEGYQARSRKRSWEIVAAIWAAVSQRGLTYAEPPASFGQDGQKVRLPSMIEEQGLATCLDTALFFAAAFEQAGLNPLIVFTEGHALAGAWLQPQTLPALTVESPMEIRKAIAQDELLVFETTMATGGRAVPLSQAINEARRQVSEEHEQRFIYAIDIRQARGRDIQPLAALAVGAANVHAGATDGRGATVPLDAAPDLPPFSEETIAEAAPQTPAERLERWKRSLLDLSKRNRLLNLRPSATAIPIFCPDTGLLEDKIAEGRRIGLITPPERRNTRNQPDPELYHLRTGENFAEKFAAEALRRDEIVANVEPATLEKGVIELFRKAKSDFEEGGSNTLFLALGMLRWSPPGDEKRSYRAPLIMLPVKLQRRSAASKPFLTGHTDDPTFNPTLLQMLRQDFNIDIPELARTLKPDEHGIDVGHIWELVRSRVRDVPGFEVVEEVVLSTFSFSKYLMWKDLADRTESLKATLFVRHMIDTPRDPYQSGASIPDPRAIDRTIAPAEVMAPLNADSSQIVAIYASGKGGDFVLEGPPGTGKSETIANIIAHNLGLGQRVLFVSEKMAALDVVSRRLSACGLGEFCLELHSAKANKEAVLAQLGVAWKARRAHSVDEWGTMASRLEELRDQLNGLVEALHAPGPGGISPRQAIGRSVSRGGLDPVRLDWERDENGRGRAPTPETRLELEQVVKRLGQQFGQIQPEDLAAFRDVTHTEWSYAWADKMVTAAHDLAGAVEELVRRRKAFAEALTLPDVGDDPDETRALVEIAALVPDCARVNLRFGLGVDGRETMDTLEALLEQLQGYRGSREGLSADYPDECIVSAPLKAWQSERQAGELKIWPVKAFARRRLRKAMWRGLGLQARSAPKPEADLDSLVWLAGRRSDIDKLATRLPQGTPWGGMDTAAGNATAALKSGRGLRAAITRLSGADRVAETRELLARALCDGREGCEAGMPLAAAAEHLVGAYRAFEGCHDLFRSVRGPERDGEPKVMRLDELARVAADIAARQRRLNVWCGWIGVAREAREAGLGTLVAALESRAVPHDQLVDGFRTAYACWLAPILIDARPALNRFSAVQHEDVIRTFRETDRKFAELTTAYIRARLSGGSAGRKATQRDPGFGVLSHELQKKSRRKPVRQLVSEMGRAFTELTPCLMMSPLSVAQFLPVESEPFDLVVFDEASQITVPDAIGAIARGKRCIVVGDPKQMPPTRFFERGGDEDENEETRDLESILDEALAARVPHHRLTGHYRSRHESLICFSNHAYYQGSLVTYPSVDTRDSTVTFRRIAGVYAKGLTRTNPIEAKALVAEVVRRLRDPDHEHLSIGIVTLNSEQQRLIEDLLDQERRADPELERFFRDVDGATSGNQYAPVFVKNLETVQGDQRDVILLSIGYGPTDPGARTMSMNFGPLNRAGGERRLNVAITRATSEVVVFASFDASMIDLSRTSAVAVRDLKNYIDFAARGPVALGQAVQFANSDDYDSEFERAVAEQLRARGWVIRTQIGASKFRIDLGVVHPDAPGRFLAGVECDGASYHSSPSARDRDRVRHIILEQLGWRLFRVWSTDFFLDPEASLEALDGKLRALLEADRSGTEECGEQGDARDQFVAAVGGGNGRGEPAGSDEAASWRRSPSEQEDVDVGIDPVGSRDDRPGEPRGAETIVDGPRQTVEERNIAVEFVPVTDDPSLPSEPGGAREVVAWNRKAAEETDATAQLCLEARSSSGSDVTQDYAEAVAWYRRAAEQGAAAAQFRLAVRYDNGEGVPQHYGEAVAWYRKAAEQGDPAGQFCLAVKYAKGQGVAQNYSDAVVWYRRAAEQGYAAAQFCLAVRYENGEGVPQDYREAVAWYRKAAQQGHADAQFNLGLSYANGQGVPQGYGEAVAWYRKAAEQGHADAQFNLGVKYANGHGVPQLSIVSYALFTLAVVSGAARAPAAQERLRIAARLSLAELEAGYELARVLSAPGRFLEVLDRHVAEYADR